MNIVAIGDKVPPGKFHFHSRFTQVVNYRNADGFLSFVGTDRALSGRALLVDGLPRQKTPVLVTASHFVVDGACLSRSGAARYDSSFGGFPDHRSLIPLVGLLKAGLLEHGHELSLAVLYEPGRRRGFASAVEKALLERFLQAFAALRAGAVPEAVERFRGVGFGLTPSGDDFITGLLYAFSAVPRSEALAPLRREILKLTGGCTALSYQFMQDAAAGSFPMDVKALFTAAVLGDEPETRRRLHDLLRHGHTSGADTVAGMIAGFEWCLLGRGAGLGSRTRG